VLGGSSGPGPTPDKVAVVTDGILIEDCCMLPVVDCDCAVGREKLNFCEALVALAVLFCDITVGNTEGSTVLEGAAALDLLVGLKFAEDCIVQVGALVT